MFYEKNPDHAFRFGDVLGGFVLSASQIDSSKLVEAKKDFCVEVKQPKYSVLLSPCCSIGDGTLALTPLIKVLPKFFTNPYLKDDLTRINRPMSPEQAVSPEVWEKMGSEEKARRLDSHKPESYSLVDYFIYDEHDILACYPLKSTSAKVDIETGFYMIDFRRIYKVDCKQVQNARTVPLEAKELQVSIQARTELRDKLSAYFQRQAIEDIA